MDRIRIPLAGFLSLVLSLFAVGVLSQGAAASSPTYGVTANGGFISLGLLGSAVVTGAGSAADATSGGPVDASGTGVCLTLAAASSPCPTTATSTLSGGDLIDTTQRSTAHSVNSSGTAAPASACLAGPLALDALSLSAACGHASASEDASGNPTADGEGDLGNSAIDLTLDSIPGLSGVLGSGALCPSGSSSSASSAVPTAVVTTILGTVNQLLGTVDPSAPAIPAPSLSSPLSALCQVLAGVTNELPALGNVLSGLTGSSPLVSIALGQSTSTVTSSTSGSDTIETSTATAQSVSLSLLGAISITLSPNTASIQLDTTTGVVTVPNPPSAGVLTITALGGAPTTSPLTELSSVVNGLLSSLGAALPAGDAPVLAVTPAASTVASDGHSGSAHSADLDLNLLGGLVTLEVGDATVTATDTPATTATAAALTTATTTTTAAPAAVTVAAPTAAPVGGVPTAVHTGEYWAGTLPIVLLSGMAAAGLLLIGRRRIAAVARSLVSLTNHSASGSAHGPPPGPASGTSSVPPPVSGPARWQSPR